MEYEFKLSFKINAREGDHDQIMMKLADADCADALVGLGVGGHVSLEFMREANSALEAMLQAIDNVRQALPSAQLIEACPDLVGLTDVADIVGVSRQNMRKLMITHAERFPSPVHAGTTSIWHLADVLHFMQEREMAYPHAVYEVARATLQLNVVKEKRMHSAWLDAQLEKSLKV